ncbi:hypothetical protein BRC83_06410 [Halobacteriales archaeon QS_1_68_17]|nr:MAG: hypothetical protein BRC83_06410 [Halobacteriales archaeon QS_1_68_17]
MLASPNGTALFYVGLLRVRFVKAYAVDGTLYSLAVDENGIYTVRERPYSPGRIGLYEYAPNGTREWNGRTVRVFEVEFTDPVRRYRREVVDLTSTVYVDRRGIVRKLVHRETYRPTGGSNVSLVTQNDTFEVTDVGSTRLPHPESFCTVDSAPVG